MDLGESSGPEAGASKSSDSPSESHSDGLPETQRNVEPPDTNHRDATELQLWPSERAPSMPESDASYWAHFRHRINSFSLNARVPPSASRDHLANERTFLGWVRTSLSLAMLGTVIAQLFRLQPTTAPRPFGFYHLGVPLASTCHAAALLTILVGAQRYRMQQNAMLVGRIQVAGWEPWFILVMVTMASHYVPSLVEV